MPVDATERIDRCKARLLFSHPWWASLLFHLRVSPSDRVPTMATDGTHLKYNPSYVASLSEKETMGVLLHEVAHCALAHPYRRGWRNPLRWNIAADQAANALLLADGILLPKGAIPAGELSKTVEELYDQNDSEQEIIQDVYGPGEIGEDEPGESGPGGSPAESEMTEDSWRETLAMARGLEPGHISRTIEAATKKEIDWKDELTMFVSATCKSTSRTWCRPSRRVRNLPGWKREPQSNIAVVIDTSGSVDSSQLAEFVEECKALTSLHGIIACIISADAAVHRIIEPGGPWPDSLDGGGGTSFVPALKEAERREVDAVVYLTDGDGDFPSSCRVPVLWALTTKKEVPFGKALYIK